MRRINAKSKDDEKIFSKKISYGRLLKLHLQEVSFEGVVALSPVLSEDEQVGEPPSVTLGSVNDATLYLKFPPQNIRRDAGLLKYSSLHTHTHTLTQKK